MDESFTLFGEHLQFVSFLPRHGQVLTLHSHKLALMIVFMSFCYGSVL